MPKARSRATGHASTEDAKVAELGRLIGQLTIENSLFPHQSLKKVLQAQKRLRAEQEGGK